MSSDKQNILLIGAGKMGGAMLQSWTNNPNLFISVLDPGLTPALKEAKKKGVSHIKSVGKLVTKIDIAVLAIKPQLFKDVASNLHQNIPNNALIISVLAGTSIKTIQTYFPNNPIIRAMPNTPAAIGKGITAVTGNSLSTKADIDLAKVLLAACGIVRSVESEALIDAVTAISGSGPAYIFYFVEALTKAACDLGLRPEDAEIFARQTVIGAGALLEKSKSDAEQLRRNVTSPHGTTHAALEILMSDEGLLPLLKSATRAAYNRAEELAKD